jgi:hypothetical protein
MIPSAPQYPDLAPVGETQPIDHLVSLLAHLLRDINLKLHDLTQRWFGTDEDPGPGLGLCAAARAWLEDKSEKTCAAMTALLDLTRDGAQLSLRYKKELAEYQAARAAFYEQLRARIVYVGSDEVPRTHAVVAVRRDGRLAAFSRDAGHVILAAGIPGSGKTQMSTNLAEALLHEEEGLTGPEGRATAVINLFTDRSGRLPQQLAGLRRNPNEQEVAWLTETLGVPGAPLPELVLAMPRALIPQFEKLLRPYLDLGLRLVPLQFPLWPLGPPGLEAVVGAHTGAQHLQEMVELGCGLGPGLTLEAWREKIRTAQGMLSQFRGLALAKLDPLEGIAGPPEGPDLWDVVKPRRYTVLYLGPPMAKRVATGLVGGLMNGLMQPSPRHGPFQRLFIKDEVNEHDKDDPAWQHYERAARLIRHLGSTLLLMGQDLNPVSDELFGLARMTLVFRLTNAKVFEHIQARVPGLAGFTARQVNRLLTGHALVAVTASTDPEWRERAQEVWFRYLMCEHGGFTRAEI